MSFEILYETYFSSVYKYLFRRVGSTDTAEDITQIVFMEVYRSFKKLDLSKYSHPLVYLYTISRRRVIDHYRKQEKQVDINDEDLTFLVDQNSDMSDPHKDLLQNETSQVIALALQKLKPIHREVLELKFLQNFSAPQIAEVVNKKPDAVRQMLVRATKELKKHIPQNY